MSDLDNRLDAIRQAYLRGEDSGPMIHELAVGVDREGVRELRQKVHLRSLQIVGAQPIVWGLPAVPLVMSALLAQLRPDVTWNFSRVAKLCRTGDRPTGRRRLRKKGKLIKLTKREDLVTLTIALSLGTETLETATYQTAT